MKIAISGHRPDAFLVSHYSGETVERIVNDVVTIFKREYKDDLLFNLGGAIGIDQLFGRACIKQKIPYILYLPFQPEIQSKFWEQEQKDELLFQIEYASGIDIINPNGDVYDVINYQLRNERMINDASFLIAFWVGKRRGGTFNAIKFALGQSKFALNGLNELKPIFTEDLKKGWTPPTMEQK